MEILLPILAALLFSESRGDTCTNCFSTYTNAKAISDTSTVCSTAFAYATCIDTAEGAGCPPSPSNYNDFNGVITDQSCNPIGVCVCQKDNILRLVLGQDDECTSLKKKFTCLGGETTKACDAVSLSHTVAGTTNSRITALSSCSLTNLCACERTYALTDISVQANRCTAKKTFIGCIRGKTDASCTSGETIITLANAVATTITTDCSGFSTSLCQCELTYVQADISSTTLQCTAIRNLVSCVLGKTGDSCATGTTASSLTTTFVDTNLPSCSPTDTCNCEGTYAKADISTTANKCAAQKVYITCLMDKTNTGCIGTTVINLATAVGSDISCTDFTTTACYCQNEYAKDDISDDTKKCLAKKTMVTCLLGKGAGCSAETAASIATTVLDPDIPDISCSVTGTLCDSGGCEETYAKADISTPANHCTALGVFVDCLKTKTTPACSGAAITTLGTVAETNYGTLTTHCAITDTPCSCEVDFIKMSYSGDTSQCTAERTIVSCLKYKDGSGCNSGTRHGLAATAAGRFGTITDCVGEVTATCTCESTFSQTDITSDNPAKCSAVETYLNCLKTQTDNGCVSSDTVPTLATAAETYLNDALLGCTVTGTCTCEIAYIKAVRNTAGTRCTAALNLVSCVTGLTDFSCDGSTLPSALATEAKNIINTDCTSPVPTDTCSCEIEYAEMDLNTADTCTAKLTYMDCLSQAYDNGCTGTSRSNLAAAAQLDISACTSKTAVCDCQATYARVDNTDNTLQCDAISAFLDCIDLLTDAGCEATTTAKALATHVEGRVSPTTSCSITSSCQCQANYMMATRTDAAETCTALKSKLYCLIRARDNGCDGTTPRDQIVDAIDGDNTGLTSCTYSTTCSACMLPYGITAYSDSTTHCSAIDTMLGCIYSQDPATGTGCDGTVTLPTIVGEFDSVGSCTFSTTCSCQITYMRNPTSPSVCTAQSLLLNCLDGTLTDDCGGTNTRDTVATNLYSSMDGACKTGLTATCGTCQKDYAVTAYSDDTVHCTAARKKLGCLSGEKSMACDSAVLPNTVASTASTLASTGITSCAAAITDTCQCEIDLAITNIQVDGDHCTALATMLGCLVGLTSTGCETATTVTALDLSAKQDINTIGSCSVTDTCTCEVNYAISTLTTDSDKCTAALAEAVCLYSETAVGCDGSSTRDTIYWSLLAWMDTVTTANGATAKCTTNAVCLCEIGYAAERSTGECAAYKNLISCLGGLTGTGCDETTTVVQLATFARDGIIGIGSATCPLLDTCSCETAYALADISDSTKLCNEQLKHMNCLYNSVAVGCDGTTPRHTVASDLESAMTGSCLTGSSTVCQTCMLTYAKEDMSTNQCTGLSTLLDCLDGLADLTVTSCDGLESVAQLATEAETDYDDASCTTRTGTCDCIVAFLKAGSGALCTAYKTKMDCIVATTDATCDGTARHTYAGTVESKMDTACGAAQPAGSVCQDCEIVFAKAASTCVVLATYYNCLWGLTASGTSCDGTKTIKNLVDEQDSLFSAESCDTSATAATAKDTCVCQVAYLKSARACSNQEVLMDCLWAAEAEACDDTTTRDVIATSANGDIDTTCRNLLSNVCKCQIAYNLVDPGDQTSHCTGLKTQMQCLEGETGTGCQSKTLIDVATGINTKLTDDSSCTPTDTCNCQIAYLMADVSGVNSCPETQKKIDCLYATTSKACDETTLRTTIMSNTVPCSYTSSCTCMRDYGIDTSSDECTYRLGVITCLQDTVDAGCTGSITTQTRTQLANGVETYVTNSCPTTTDTCNCQIDYAKATVSPVSPDKCNALFDLILCLAGKTALGCDGSSTPATLASAAYTKIQDDGCDVKDSCLCEINYAMADIGDETKKCSQQRIKMNCLYNAVEMGCDRTSERHTLANTLKGEMDSFPSTGTSCLDDSTAVCQTCMISYAEVDMTNAAAKCSGLGDLLDCLDGLADLTEASCDGSETVVELAAEANSDWGSSACGPHKDTCNCILAFLASGTTSLCDYHKTKMDCLVASTEATCGGTARQTYGATAVSALEAAGVCGAQTAGTVCKDCEMVFVAAAPTCVALATYYHCLWGLRAAGTSCSTSKTIKNLVDEQDSLYSTTSCASTAATAKDTCQCQVTYLKSVRDCSNQEVLMDCLWAAEVQACDDTTTRDVIATSANGDIDTTCRNSLSNVCKCQIAYNLVDPGHQPSHCLGLKTQMQCLEGETGTGCQSKTLIDVATGINTKLTDDTSCTPTDTCNCQIAYLMADVSGVNSCPETQKKIDCLYATTTKACDETTPRTTIMSNTVSCGYTSSCGCMRSYGIDTSSNECTNQLGVITCLQDTVDAGCTGSTTTQTRTQLANGVDTYVTTGSNNCLTTTDTCNCQIAYAKATVTPVSPDKCNALATLLLCLGGKTDVGCDGTRTPSQLAADTTTKMQTECTPITNTCNCQIAYATTDVSTVNKCTALLNQIECIFGTEDAGCDGTSRTATANAVIGDLNTDGCTAAATDTCTQCIYTYAAANLPTTKCQSLGELLHCLDGQTTTSCKDPSPLSVVTLATNARTDIQTLGLSCTALTDTCECQYNYITATGAACVNEAARIECLVDAVGVACDGSTARSAYTTNTAYPALQLVTGCETGLTDTCTACEVVYASATSTTQANRCDALKAYFHCLDSKTAVSCFGSKSITTLATEADQRATGDNCLASLGDTCVCQANYLKQDKSTAALKCTALKDKLSCLAISFDPACDGTSTRDTVADTTNGMITDDSCTGITDVCTCERTYAGEPFSVSSTHCDNLKTAVNCLEGETAAGCGQTTTISSFATVVLNKINTLNPTCDLSDTCQCQVTYLSDDVSTSALKCTALEKKQACLYQSTAAACDGTTARKDVIISVDGDITTASCGSSIPGTCRCQIAYGSSTLTPDSVKCTAMKTMISCLQTTDDDGCVGTVTATRAAVATSLEDFVGNSVDCSIANAACQCQVDYGKAAVSTPTDKCTAQKTLAVCLGDTDTAGCINDASHTLAAAAVAVINSIGSCAPAAGSTCQCQLDYAVMDRITSVGLCSATKALVKCLEMSTGLGCDGSTTKLTLANAAETFMDNGLNSCPKTATCDCQVELAKQNIDATADKCSALKTKAVCLRSTNAAACDGTTKVVEATSTESALDAMGDAQCHVEDSCRCEIAHAKTDTSSDTCTPAKTLVHCLTSAKEAGCTSTKVAVGNTANNEFMTLGAGCPLTSSCTCQKDYVITSTTTDTTRCSGLKTLILCLGNDNDAACDGTTTKVTLATNMETAANDISSCASGITDTCQCQINYAKTLTNTNPLKCAAYNQELTCLFPATAVSCLGTSRTDQVATNVNTAVSFSSLGCTAPSDECTCATTYAMVDTSLGPDKCTAAKNLLSCMSGKTGIGCNGVQQASTIITAAEGAIQEVVAGGGTCALSNSCQCEVAFGQADPSQCSSVLSYFACLYPESDNGCASTSNSVLQTNAKNLMSTIPGCSLEDTCQCEETYRINYAANTSQQCKFVKNALSCLSTSSSMSCDGTETKVAVTTRFENTMSGLTGCMVTPTCTCQIELGKMNITDDTLKCNAGNTFLTCLNAVTINEDVGCDDITQMRFLRTGTAAMLTLACKASSVSPISLLTMLIVAVVALMVKQ